ncbi:transporter [Leptospira kobayashii]|uniref:Transporter n=1 Tax=Leptospira kobayashii TaxID=1917830 RepID=A0ABN6K9C7_9LEPT|nr:bile acid:sodium symporter family protein [Leptospira kobayashii]BDA77423.1 transporter [Leptospira kobayashii]
MGSTSFFVTYLLPGALALIMFGLGLSLTVADFARVVRFPKSVVIGLVCQMFLLPLFGLGICHAFGLSPELSIGVMILAASPGGVAANLFSHFAKGDVALNLTLTAVNSVLAAVTLPLIVNFSISYFSDGNQSIGLQFQKTIEVFFIILIPVVFGMFGKKHFPNFAEKMDKPVRIFSFIFLFVIIAATIAKEKHRIVDALIQVGIPVYLFNILSLATGYILPLLAKVRDKEAIAISMEVGIHNGTLAVYVAISLLGSYELALPAAVYSIFMFKTAGIFTAILIKRNKEVSNVS